MLESQASLLFSSWAGIGMPGTVRWRARKTRLSRVNTVGTEERHRTSLLTWMTLVIYRQTVKVATLPARPPGSAQERYAARRRELLRDEDRDDDFSCENAF